MGQGAIFVVNKSSLEAIFFSNITPNPFPKESLIGDLQFIKA